MNREFLFHWQFRLKVMKSNLVFRDYFLPNSQCFSFLIATVKLAVPDLLTIELMLLLQPPLASILHRFHGSKASCGWISHTESRLLLFKEHSTSLIVTHRFTRTVCRFYWICTSVVEVHGYIFSLSMPPTCVAILKVFHALIHTST